MAVRNPSYTLWADATTLPHSSTFASLAKNASLATSRAALAPCNPRLNSFSASMLTVSLSLSIPIMPPVLLVESPMLLSSCLASAMRPFSVFRLPAIAFPKSLCCCSWVRSLYVFASVLNALTSSFTLSFELVAPVAMFPKAFAASTFFSVNLPNSLPASVACLA